MADNWPLKLATWKKNVCQRTGGENKGGNRQRKETGEVRDGEYSQLMNFSVNRNREIRQKLEVM